MSEKKSITPLKIGLLIVTLAYFLFTLRSLFVLEWIGEWERIAGGSIAFRIFVEDISATVGLIFRFVASLIAVLAMVIYISKNNLSKSTAYKIVRVILVFEGIYWLGLIASAGFSVQTLWIVISRNTSSVSIFYNSLYTLSTIIEAVVLPVALFILAYKLSPNKLIKHAIKWSLISGTIVIAVFWLINTSIWVSVMRARGLEYLVTYPEHLLSFIVTTAGLAALTLYSAYTAKKTTIESLQELNLRPVGVIVLSLGMFFLWNYLSWVLFAGDTWNNWYAWFLGHNMDLWMLTLPLIGLPLLYQKNQVVEPPKS